MSTQLIDDDFTMMAIPLGQAMVAGCHWMSGSLLSLMHARGHEELTVAHLMFCSHLNCGRTHASEVARRMGITRQAVYKTTKDLQELGILKLLPDPENRRQKIISMTKRGALMAEDYRSCMAIVEGELRRRIGEAAFDNMSHTLRRDWGPPLTAEPGGSRP